MASSLNLTFSTQLFSKDPQAQQEIYLSREKALKNSPKILQELDETLVKITQLANETLPKMRVICASIEERVGSKDVFLNKNIEKPGLTTIFKASEETQYYEILKVAQATIKALPEIDLSIVPLTTPEGSERVSLNGYCSSILKNESMRVVKQMDYRNTANLKVKHTLTLIEDLVKYLSEFTGYIKNSKDSLQYLTKSNELTNFALEQALLQHVILFSEKPNSTLLINILKDLKTNDEEKKEAHDALFSLIIRNTLAEKPEKEKTILDLLASTYDPSGKIIKFITLNRNHFVTSATLDQQAQKNYLKAALKTLLKGPSLDQMSPEALLTYARKKQFELTDQIIFQSLKDITSFKGSEVLTESLAELADQEDYEGSKLARSINENLFRNQGVQREHLFFEIDVPFEDDDWSSADEEDDDFQDEAAAASAASSGYATRDSSPNPQ